MVSRYLKFESSRPLRILHLDDTDISARDIAAIFRALGRDRYGGVRDIHIDITGNRLYPLDPINAALTDDAGPSSLTMRMAEFQKPVEFWRFIEAITKIQPCESSTSLRRFYASKLTYTLQDCSRKCLLGTTLLSVLIFLEKTAD